MNGQEGEAESSTGAVGSLGALEQELDLASSDAALKWSLHLVPGKLRFQNLRNSPFIPSVVSIGPLHYGDPRFADMEKQKLRYMASLLRRNTRGDRRNTLTECVAKISELASQAQESYNDILSSRGSGSGDFCKLLVVDGCFILELLIRSYKADVQATSNTGELRHPIFRCGTDTNDPLLNITWMGSILRLDLALLENQIPFSILEGLLCVIAGNEFEELPVNFLARMAFTFFKPLLQNACLLSAPVSAVGEPRAHLLSLLWNSYKKPQPADAVVIRIDYNSAFLAKRKLIPNVSKLTEIGIAFEPVADRNLVDIEFHNGVFKIPPLHLIECTESYFSNLMAYECCLENPSQIIASYVVLMSQLVQIPEDVNLLEAQGIISNGLGNGVAVCSMFHRLVTQSLPSISCFDDLCDKVNIDMDRRRSFGEKFKRGYMPTRVGNIRFMVLYFLVILCIGALISASSIPNYIVNSYLTLMLLLAYPYRKLCKDMRGMRIQFTE